VKVVKKSTSCSAPNEFHDDEDHRLDDVEKQVGEFDVASVHDVKETNVDIIVLSDEELDNSGVRTRLKNDKCKAAKRRRKQVRFTSNCLLCEV